MPITDPNQEYFKDGAWGWNGSKWVKNGIAFAYFDVYGESEAVAVTETGSNVMTFATVPAGEMWVITNISAASTTSDPSTCFFDVAVNGTFRALVKAAYPTAAVTVDWRGQVYLKEGDYARVTFNGCVYGHWVGAWAVGYKVKVA